MDLYLILFSLWALAVLNIGLLWYIHHLNESASQEREKLMFQFTDQLKIMSQERKDLYDRLMAGTLPQYKEQQVDPNETNVTQDDETVALDDAKDDLMGIQNDDE